MIKIRLKDGFGPITNSKLSIYPGQILNVKNGTPFDSEVIEVIKVNNDTGLEVFDGVEEQIKEEIVEETIVASTEDFKEIEETPIEAEEVKVEKVKSKKLTIKLLNSINGIGKSTARKILKIAKTTDELIEKDSELREKLRDDYIDTLNEYFKGE